MARSARSSDRRENAPVLGNPKARWKYEVLERLDCGIVLVGSEVKSLRGGRGSIEEAYARFRGAELWLVGMHIDEYGSSGYTKHEPRRARKLLAHRDELTRFQIEVERRGLTMVPLRLFWNERGIAKVEIGLVRGRKLHDKRAVDREKTARREVERAMRRR